MRLVDIEKEIKHLIETDPNNEDIFNRIYDLAYLYFKRTKYVNSDEESKGVALICAEDIYMKYLRGTPIYSYIGYINKAKILYVKTYRKMTESEIFDTRDDYRLREAIEEIAYSSADAYKKYMEIDFEDSLNSIPYYVDKILKESCRYRVDSSEYLNIKISICMTLAVGEITTLFLPNNLDGYFKLMLKHVKDRLLEEIYQDNVDYVESLINNISLLQDYTLENLDEDNYD